MFLLAFFCLAGGFSSDAFVHAGSPGLQLIREDINRHAGEEWWSVGPFRLLV